MRLNFVRSLVALSVCATFLATTATAQPQPRWDIETFAGTVPGPDGPALDAFLGEPRDVAIDPQGNLLIVDSQFNRIRQVTPAGTISSFAGTGDLGSSPDSTPAAQADIGGPSSIVTGPQGEVYFFDGLSTLVRKIDAAGMLSTVAGNGIFPNGEVPDGGLATEFPLGGAIDFIDFDPRSATLYIGQDDQIWRVNDGRIFHHAGTGEAGFGGDGGPPTAARFNNLVDIAVGPDGSVYLADQINFRIRMIDAAGATVTTVAGNGQQNFNPIPDGTTATATGINWVSALAVDSAGRLHYADIFDTIYRLEPDSTLTTVANLPDLAGETATASRMVFDPAGKLIIADVNHRRVRELSADSTELRTVAGGLNIRGDGGPALAARFHNPSDVAFDSQGRLLIADTGNRAIRRVSTANEVSTLAGNGSNSFSTSDEGVPAAGAGIGGISHVAADAADAVLFEQFRSIRRITPAGLLETLPGFDNSDPNLIVGAFTRAPDGRIYLVNTLDSTVLEREPDGTLTRVAGNGEFGFSGDGGPATDASFGFISDLEVDDAGNLYLVDRTARRVRKVDASDGTVSTIFGEGGLVAPVTGLSAERVSDPGGVVAFPSPSFIAFANRFNELYVITRSIIYRVLLFLLSPLSEEAQGLNQGVGQAALLTQIAGTGLTGFSGDGGDATQARFSNPQGMTFGPDGRLYIADRGNHRIRVLTPTMTPFAPDDAVTNAASFIRGAAPDSILSLFGLLLTLETQIANQLPLPTTLADATLEVIDSTGTAHTVQLFFVSERQINFLMPPEVALGPATMRLTRAGATAESAITIRAVAPGLFTMNASGSGVGAIIAIRVAQDGTRSSPEVFRFNAETRQFVGVPIDLGPPGDQVFLSLFGTGIRGVSSASQLSATANGQDVPVLGFAPSAEFLGLDQVNIGPLPRSLAGAGEVEIVLTIDPAVLSVTDDAMLSLNVSNAVTVTF